MIAGSPQNHTDVAFLGVLRGLLCQMLLTCPDRLYLFVLPCPALRQFGLELQQAALHMSVQAHGQRLKGSRLKGQIRLYTLLVSLKTMYPI